LVTESFIFILWASLLDLAIAKTAPLFISQKSLLLLFIVVM